MKHRARRVIVLARLRPLPRSSPGCVIECELKAGEEMNLAERITIDPQICHGKPTIRGLRYPVQMILELLSSGMTTDQILADYEDLERDDILAALDFARQLSQIKRIEPIVA